VKNERVTNSCQKIFWTNGVLIKSQILNQAFILEIARSTVDPAATPAPIAAPAYLQPLPDLKRRAPMMPPTKTPEAVLTRPDSICSSILGGSFHVGTNTSLGLLDDGDVSDVESCVIFPELMCND